MSIGTWSGGKDFLRRGSSGSITTRDLDIVEMQPREYYTGQLYAAIRTRANRVAYLAREHTKTRLFNDPNQELAIAEDQHPYLKLINESPSFANTYFWRSLSTFLDLTGKAYIFVLRNPGNGNLVGTPKEFKIVNPYNLTRVVNESTGDTKYIETRGAAWREIPEEQLIVVQSFNPFNLNDGYAMVDAARDDQFSIQQARDYTRKAVKKNVGQRGLLTTDVIMDDIEFKNFKDKVKAGETGDFLFGNGPDALKYTDMQIDLDKLALDSINRISTESLIAVSGASKTILGIEQSGVTRDTARVQQDLFDANHAIPQLDDIIDSLNQDYKTRYQNEYQSRQLELFVDSPLKVDKDRDLKDAQIEKTKAEAAKVLIDTGYDPDSVTKMLEMDDELKFEARQPKVAPMPQQTPQEDTPPDELQNALNSFTPGIDRVVRGFESTLANQVENIESQLFALALPKLSEGFAKNAVSQKDALNKKDRERLEKELAVALAAFGGNIVSLFGSQTMSKRFVQFRMPGEFTMDKAVNKAIKSSASKAATSHINTFLDASLSEARKAGLEGLSREQISSRLTGAFPDLSKTNATRIARTESYKAVNMAQYEADKQFLEQNGLETQAYKRWTVQSANPCPYCQELDGQEIPFDESFVDMGDAVTVSGDDATTKQLFASYEDIDAGNLHPNCSCTYELVVR